MRRASISTWHINKAHYLESWSDARAYDGTISIIQPMIDPMYGGKSAHDVLQTLLDNPQASAYDAVVANAKTYIKGDFAAGWRKALHDGWVEGTAFTAKAGVPARGDAVRCCSGFEPRAMRSRSGPILRSTTDALRMSAGCRSCPSR